MVIKYFYTDDGIGPDFIRIYILQSDSGER